MTGKLSYLRLNQEQKHCKEATWACGSEFVLITKHTIR